MTTLNVQEEDARKSRLHNESLVSEAEPQHQRDLGLGCSNPFIVPG